MSAEFDTWGGPEEGTGISVPWAAKIFGPAKPLLLRVGDRQPVRQTPVVP